MNGASDGIHKVLRRGVLAAYAVSVEWISVRSGNPTDYWWWLADIPWFLWIVAPIAAPLLLPISHWLLTVTVAVMAAFGIYVYVDSMFGPGARSTSALIFIFLPVYQWVGTAVLLVIALVMSRRTSQ